MTNEIVKRDELVLSHVTRRDVLDEVKSILTELDETGDMRRAQAGLKTLDTIQDTAGLGKAYLLWGMQRWHKLHSQSQEEFFSSIGITDGQKVTYSKRLINLWDQIQKKAIPTDVQKKSVKLLIPIARALADGYAFDEEDWGEVRLATNEAQIGEIIHKIKKTKPRADLLSLWMAADGSLYVQKGDQREFYGYLDVEHEDVELVAQAIARTVNNTPIKRNR